MRKKGLIFSQFLENKMINNKYGKRKPTINCVKANFKLPPFKYVVINSQKPQNKKTVQIKKNNLFIFTKNTFDNKNK